MQKIKLSSALPFWLLAAALPGHAVTIQFAGGFGTGSGNFTGVADLSGCSGTLMADGIHVLTAAHCVAGVSVNSMLETVLTPVTPSLAFFTPSDPNGFVDAVTGIQFNPLTSLWFPTDPANSGLTYDLAMLDLATPAPADATRYNLDLSGDAITNKSPVTMAGWGLGGYPGGSVAGTGGTRRGGTNVVAGVFTSVGDGFLSANLPDTPIALYWTTTSDTGKSTDTLGLSNAGDSGGPLLYNGNVIGITDFGNLPRGDAPLGDNIQVGTTYEAGYADLANPGNADWLNSVLEDTPEPGTWMLAAGGTLLVLLRRRAVRR